MFYLDKTTQYVYNGIGNIESVTTTSSSGTTSTQSFTYGDTANPDRLTQFGTKAITYNAIGCPTSYNGRSFNWNNGKLKSITKGSVKDWSLPYETYTYTYNAKGQRTSKTYFYRPPDNLSLIGNYLRNTNIGYTYDNSGRLIREKRTLTYSDFSTLAIEFIYLYDESGIIGVQFTYGDEAPQLFYYQRNLQGDVVAIYNTSGVLQAKYSYDAWGNCTVANSTNVQIANYNPIRYRGYYLDSETNWYFLNARYYSPEWRRFVSPDDTAYLDPETPNGLNLYCYCGNDPINYCDPSGHKLEWLGWLIGGALIVASIAITIASLGTLSGVAIGALAVTGAITGGVAGALNAASTGGNIGQGMITGALVGIAGAFSPLAGGLMATGMSLINDRINNENFNLDSVKKAIISGVTAYTFAYGSAELANLMLASGGNALLTWTAYGVSNFIFASHNFATDTILYHILN